MTAADYEDISRFAVRGKEQVTGIVRAQGILIEVPPALEQREQRVLARRLPAYGDGFCAGRMFQGNPDGPSLPRTQPRNVDTTLMRLVLSEEERCARRVLCDV